MNRRDNGPARPSSADAYPESAKPYLEGHAYPVDPGYQYGGEPRPADPPAGAMRTRPEGTVPPRASRQTQPDPMSRPWQGPGAAPSGNVPPGDEPPGLAYPRPPAGRRPRWARATRFRPVETQAPFPPNGSTPSRPAPPPPPGGEQPQYGPGNYFDVFTPANRGPHESSGAPGGSGVPGTPYQPPYSPDWPGAGAQHGPGGQYAPGPPRGAWQQAPSANPYGTSPPGGTAYGPRRQPPPPGPHGQGANPYDTRLPAGPAYGAGQQSARQYGPGAPYAGYGQAPPGAAGAHPGWNEPPQGWDGAGPAGRGPAGPGRAGPGTRGGHPYDPAGPGPYGPDPAGPAQGGSGQPGPGQFPQYPYGPPPGTEGRPGPAGWGGTAGKARPRDTVAPAGADQGAGGSERAGGTIIGQRDTALPDPSPGAASGPIAAIETDTIAAFARDLRALRAKAGLDYLDMAEKSHYTMRTLASAAGGLRPPTLPVLIAYVRACGGDQAEWEERWGKLMKATEGQAALPASGPEAATAGDPSAASGARTQASAPRAPAPGPAQAQTKADEVYVITSAPERDNRW